MAEKYGVRKNRSPAKPKLTPTKAPKKRVGKPQETPKVATPKKRTKAKSANDSKCTCEPDEYTHFLGARLVRTNTPAARYTSEQATWLKEMKGEYTIISSGADTFFDDTWRKLLRFYLKEYGNTTGYFEGIIKDCSFVVSKPEDPLVPDKARKIWWKTDTRDSNRRSGDNRYPSLWGRGSLTVTKDFKVTCVLFDFVGPRFEIKGEKMDEKAMKDYDDYLTATEWM
ncbi:hypothetical protein H072_11092 [Dactylellina haptotyla CBS 200.50]|uniref:Uncharacterized protein n=1 Tax=Dactylellina haptotyla (strain CBS 200.50) TaxID=1284197 RepID=S8B8V9_DACHA|nr:hypothetical protein H072_11092 [Dactylellina haptotyla CBS 200.50]